jgi:dTDP-4-dehydrorhamnose reductase
LVIGSTGLLGQEMVRAADARGVETVGTFAHGVHADAMRLLLEDGEEVRRRIEEVAPEAVVLCGAMASMDECERRPRDAFDVNVEGPMSVATACAEIGARLLLFSSDAVFGEHGAARLHEFDMPDPPSIYGKTKLEAERLVMDASRGNVVCRLGMLYGARPRGGRHNLASLVREECAAGREVRLASDHFVTPTYAPEAAAASLELLLRGLKGTWHVCGPSCVSKYEFALAVADEFALPSRLLAPARTEELEHLAPRSLRACMSNEKLLASLDVRMSSPAEGLRLLRSERR